MHVLYGGFLWTKIDKMIFYRFTNNISVLQIDLTLQSIFCKSILLCNRSFANRSYFAIDLLQIDLTLQSIFCKSILLCNRSFANRSYFAIDLFANRSYFAIDLLQIDLTLPSIFLQTDLRKWYYFAIGTTIT